MQGVPTATDWEISIHALREESDRTGRWRSAAPSYFNPRPPRGERLNFKITVHFCRRFQSTPSARRATPRLMRLRTPRHRFQSTPSARRATNSTSASCTAFCNFNPRPPRGERPPPFFTQLPNGQFQSTPSARRATSVSSNPFAVASISIHALREESDDGGRGNAAASTNFNPRPPRGERLRRRYRPEQPCSDFNPRPPRGERRLSRRRLQGPWNFNPRPPRGERPGGKAMPYGRPIFQSTPSARRATATAQACGPVGKISIHALREESDTLPVSPEPPPFPFQSTPSARRATISRLPPGKRPKISIHALREEGDVKRSAR